jgi:hypothetical protein
VHGGSAPSDGSNKMTCLKPENQVTVYATKLLIKSMISVVLFLGSAVCAQAQDPQPNSSAEAWTATTETSVANTNPSRTTERRKVWQPECG